MTTTKRVDVERLSELLEKATPSTRWVVTCDGDSIVTDDEPMHRGHVASCVEPDDAALIAEGITALPALLRQLAEAERAREEAVGLLRQCDQAVEAWKRDGESRYTTPDGVYHLVLGSCHYKAMKLQDEIDAFLAANGGRDE